MSGCCPWCHLCIGGTVQDPWQSPAVLPRSPVWHWSAHHWQRLSDFSHIRMPQSSVGSYWWCHTVAVSQPISHGAPYQRLLRGYICSQMVIFQQCLLRYRTVSSIDSPDGVNNWKQLEQSLAWIDKCVVIIFNNTCLSGPWPNRPKAVCSTWWASNSMRHFRTKQNVIYCSIWWNNYIILWSITAVGPCSMGHVLLYQWHSLWLYETRSNSVT